MRMGTYSPNTIASGVFSASLYCITFPTFLFACSVLRQHRRDAYKASASSRSSSVYPSLLRWMLVCCTGCAAIGGPVCNTMNWLLVDRETRIDTWHRTSMESFDLASRLCAVTNKVACVLYVSGKLFSYLSFFIKQRTVRPLDKPSLIEKVALLFTCGIVFFAALCGIVAQGDYNQLDGSCQLYIGMEVLMVMAVADSSLSFIYLWLFIGPLRETIRANQKARASAALSAAVVRPTDVSRGAASPELQVRVIEPKPAAAGEEAKPVLNTTLESVMRRNSLACILAVCSSFCTMLFMLTALGTDHPYARKWGIPAGQFDITFTAACLAYIMYKPSSSAPARSAGGVSADLRSTTEKGSIGTTTQQPLVRTTPQAEMITRTRAASPLSPSASPLPLERRADTPTGGSSRASRRPPHRSDEVPDAGAHRPHTSTGLTELSRVTSPYGSAAVVVLDTTGTDGPVSIPGIVDSQVQ